MDSQLKDQRIPNKKKGPVDMPPKREQKIRGTSNSKGFFILLGINN
jgi:hypothetical protein